MERNLLSVLSPQSWIPMLHAIGVLARMQFVIARNTFWRGKIGRKILLILTALGLSAAAYGLYRLTQVIVETLTSQDFADFLARAARTIPGLSLDAQLYVLALPSAVLFLALVLMVLTSF